MVLATQEKTPATTKSGLYLVSGPQKKAGYAVVLAVGPAVISLKAGAKIIYKEYTDNQFSHDGCDYILISDDDVLAEIVGWP